MKEIEITVRGHKIKASLNDSVTAQNIWNALPFHGELTRWGDEIYFPCPVSMEREAGTARTDVEIGELGYWPLYNAFCVFFGPTPVSTNEKPKAYSAVNVFGSMEGDLSILQQCTDDEKVIVERAGS